MKRLFLVCSLLAVTTAPVFAQSASAQTTASAQQDARVSFRNKVKELREAANQNDAMRVYAELSNMMQQSMNVNLEKVAKSTSEDEKTKAGKALEKQQAVYRDTKMMARDIMKNKAEVAAQMDSFLQTI